ncbi:hypothetical protein AAFF_G00035330 [Aldrovandia affinis]|uniref:Uncharacterized protein n=1 Tax=Aldrovandia affinis TaxID=143900 RepID=A0AAD7S3I4_9TELE|nr:hypothetical protein AAFF_G00035330 [Aldrovandia affinis]
MTLARPPRRLSAAEFIRADQIDCLRRCGGNALPGPPGGACARGPPSRPWHRHRPLFAERLSSICPHGHRGRDTASKPQPPDLCPDIRGPRAKRDLGL